MADYPPIDPSIPHPIIRSFEPDEDWFYDYGQDEYSNERSIHGGTVRGIPVHYVEQGEGRPILILHGRPLDHRQPHTRLEPIFATHPGWRRVYPDLPGMGRTPGEQGPLFRALVSEWLDRVDESMDSGLLSV